MLGKIVLVKSRNGRRLSNEGFGAMVAVVLLSFGAMAISIASTAASVDYVDSIRIRELRIQVSLNLRACLDMAEIISTKDYFVHDHLDVRELGCELNFISNSASDLSVFATSTLSAVSAYGFRGIK